MARPRESDGRPRPFGAPPPGTVACFEALDRAEAIALVDALRDAGIAAEDAVVFGDPAARHLVAVPREELPRAEEWIRAQGLGDRPRVQAELARRLEGRAIREGISVVVLLIVGPLLCFNLGGPIALLAWVIPLGLYGIARAWRRDSEKSGGDEPLEY